MSRRQPLSESLRLAYLQGLGVRTWQWCGGADADRPETLRTGPGQAPAQPSTQPQTPVVEPIPAAPNDELAPPIEAYLDDVHAAEADPGGVAPSQPARPATGSVSARAAAMPRGDEPPPAEAARAEPPEIEPITREPQAPRSEQDWDALRDEVAACRACDLHQTRTRTVFGVGDVNARLLIIGEAPGGDEDRQGEPFVGAAGRLLNEMLNAIGLSREQVFIANILKCRPPGNRDPKSGEVAACQGFLHRQVAGIAPRLIVAVGRISAQTLLETNQPIGKLRGRIHRYAATDTPLLATYHPAYLLRSPAEKRKSWQDLKLVRQALRD